jgi:hypothetical protein
MVAARMAISCSMCQLRSWPRTITVIYRPVLFRLMFGNPCADAEDVRATAAAEVIGFVLACVSQAFPQADSEALATAQQRSTTG